MRISVKTNTKDLLKDVSRLFNRQIPFATSQAINNLAFGLRAEEQKMMKVTLDRPTPFSVRGVRYKRSNKRDLTAVVFLTEIVDGYLKYQIHGGSRPAKRGRVLPSIGTKTNSYGNLPRGKSKTLRKKANVFSGKPNGKPAGIWQKMKSGRIKPLLIYEKGSMTYKKRFPWFKIGRKYVRANFDKEFTKAFNRAVKSAR